MSQVDGQVDWLSSYETNNYGDIFYALIRAYQPEVVVELGTEAGYSAHNIARGLEANQKGHLYCYDLWEDFDDKGRGLVGVPRARAEENLRLHADFVTLEQHDVYNVHELFGQVDILHVDLHNSGQVLEKTVPNWADKVSQLILIEGGSGERDKVDWMVDNKEQPIADWLARYSKKAKVEFVTLQPFPSLTIMRKSS